MKWKAKMEAGESPARSRHCNGGATVHRYATAKPLNFAGRRTVARIPEPGDMHEMDQHMRR